MKKSFAQVFLALTLVLTPVCASYGAEANRNLPQGWQDLPAPKMLELTTRVWETWPSVKEQVADCVWNKFIGTEAAWQSGDGRATILGLTQQVAAQLSDERKQALSGFLRQDIAGDPSTLQKLSASEFADLETIAQAIGIDGDARASWAYSWVLSNNKASDCNASQIKTLVGSLEAGVEENERALATSLKHRAWDEQLADLHKLAGEKPVDMDVLVQLAIPILTADQTNKLRQALIDNADDAHLAAWDTADVLAQVHALQRLGLPQQEYAKIVARWVNSNTAWKEESAVRMGGLLEAMNGSATPETAAAAKTVANGAWPKFLDNQDFLVNDNPWHYLYLAAQSAASLDAEQKAKLRQNLTQHFIEDQTVVAGVSGWEYFLLRDALLRSGESQEQYTSLTASWFKNGRAWQKWTDLSELYEIWKALDAQQAAPAMRPIYADALAQLRSGLLERLQHGEQFKENYWDSMDLATLFTDPQGSDQLEMVLKDDKYVNQEAASLESWVRFKSGKLSEWKKTLEARAAAASSADMRAQWLLARAYAEDITPGRYAPLEGKQFVEQAMATAESESVRVQALRWMVERYQSMQQFEPAGKLLVTMLPKLHEAQSHQAIAEMRNAIPVEQFDAISQQAQLQRNNELQELQGQLQSLQAKLDKAKMQQKPQEDLKSLEKMVQATQAKLDQLN